MSDSLIQNLARLIVRDNAILFIGADLSPAAEGTSGLQHIAHQLAARINYDRPDRSLPAVARDFEVLKGRNELILALREELEQQAAEQASLNQLIADLSLPQTKLVTTRYDQLLEDTLRQFDKQYVLIVRDTDVPSFDESLITLIKLHGDINQPDSLIITEDDLDAFIDRLPAISDVIRAYFATKTLIFIGYNLEGELFKRFFRQVTRNLSAFQRPAYAVVANALDEVDERYWRRFNVQVLTRDLAVFLDDLVRSVKELSKAPELKKQTLTLPRPSLPERPYKGLESYTTADAAIFRGRAEESKRLANRILAHRLTVLYGVSGSGKSSLLRAGAGPRLHKQQALLAVAAPAPAQPLTQLLRDSLAEAGQKAGLEAAETSNLLVMIRNWQAELDGPLVLAIDQFEQFFLAYQQQARAADIIFLQEMLNDRSLNLRLVLVIREDFLGQLQTLEEHIPGLLDIRFRLEQLGREAAAHVIEEPARPYGVVWERQLVQTLLDELETGSEGNIAPPQLQIVCDRLYQEVMAQRDSSSTGPVMITQAQFEALGGTESILGDYLEGVIKAFSDEQQQPARLLLGALVTTGGVKQRLPLADLARSADVANAEARQILDQLTEQRLLRRFAALPENGTEPELAYELTHDYLAGRILLWLGEDFWAAQKAREILRQALPEWQSRTRLLTPEDLQLVQNQAKRLRLNLEECELVFATAVAYAAESSEVVETLSPAARLAVLRRLLAHLQPFARRQAALQLANFSDETIPKLLAHTAVADSAAEVRQAAAEALAAVVDETAVAALVQARYDPEKAVTAEAALVTVRDLSPDSQAWLPRELRRSLQRQVWSRRWQRSRQVIKGRVIQGVKGGFWGLALGLGLFLGLANALSGGYNLITILQLPETIIQLLSVGMPLAGVVGAAAAGSAAFNGAVDHYLADRQRPWRIWAVITLTSAVVLSLGFVILALVFSGESNLVRSAAAGFVIGLVLAGAGALPWRQQTAVRLALAVAAGSAVFALAWLVGLIFASGSVLWLLLVGGVAGAGFYWALGASAPLR